MIGEAAQIARALKAHRSGDGWSGCCPCPGHGRGHGDKSPSLKIAEGGGGKLFLTCYAGCEFEEIINELKRRGIIGHGGSELARARQALRYIEPAPADHEPDPRALALWRDSDPLIGTTAQKYLQRRGIMEMPVSLRCGYYGELRALVAAVKRPDGKVVAVQSTLLARTGAKAAVAVPKITTGALGGGAVRLAAGAETMGIAEGIETSLSAQAMTDLPVWASLGSHRLHSVVLPEYVREVHIFRDNDRPGSKGAERAADAHLRAGRRVVMHAPPAAVKDYNDLLLAHADCDGDDDRFLSKVQAHGSFAS
jgi:putative DNA primase/helicase